MFQKPCCVVDAAGIGNDEKSDLLRLPTRHDRRESSIGTHSIDTFSTNSPELTKWKPVQGTVECFDIMFCVDTESFL